MLVVLLISIVFPIILYQSIRDNYFYFERGTTFFVVMAFVIFLFWLVLSVSTRSNSNIILLDRFSKSHIISNTLDISSLAAYKNFKAKSYRLIYPSFIYSYKIKHFGIDNKAIRRW